MPKYAPSGEQRLERVLSALADRTRRDMLGVLAHGPAPVSALAEPHGISLPTALGHLRVLEEAALVVTSKKGRVRTCSLQPDGLDDLATWIDAQRERWHTRFDRLAVFLGEEGTPEE